MVESDLHKILYWNYESTDYFLIIFHQAAATRKKDTHKY